MESAQRWRFVLLAVQPIVCTLIVTKQATPGVKVAVALLIKDELWGFFTPETVDIEEVKVTTERSQPYYAVPTKYIKLPDFAKTA
jgi:hypothetical protein